MTTCYPNGLKKVRTKYGAIYVIITQATTEDEEDEAVDEDWGELDDIIPRTCVFNLEFHDLGES
jgi:hypothetical protein